MAAKALNDLVFDEAGGMWFTDFGTVRKRVIEKSGLYWCKADASEIREGHFGGLGYNGVGLSPDGGTLYATASWTGRLFRFAVEASGPLRKDAETGVVVPEYMGSAAGESVFDSLAVTQSGAVCAATFIGGHHHFPAGRRDALSAAARPDRHQHRLLGARTCATPISRCCAQAGS